MNKLFESVDSLFSSNSGIIETFNIVKPLQLF